MIYPIAEWIVRVLRLDLDRLRRAFIEYNNKVMSKKMSTHSSITAQDIMVLLPHCVQNSDCLYKITLDKLENCRSCGRCSIPEFLELKKQYGVHVVVVSGGTSARELVKQKRPKFLIAVACENDLISGIRDVKGLLVFAILNERPNGPCRDTLVDVEKVKEQIIKIMSDFGGSCNEKNS